MYATTSTTPAIPAKKGNVTTEMILASYLKYQHNMLLIDIDSAFKAKTHAQYPPIYIKDIEGNYIQPTNGWLLSPEGITTYCNIRPPHKRAYENIRIGFSEVEGAAKPNPNIEALKALCISFETLIEEWTAQGIITADKKKVRMLPNGLKRPFLLMSTQGVSPMGTTRTNKDTGDIEQLINPTFWLTLPKRNYFPPGVKEHVPEQFEDQCYIDSDKPIMSFKFIPAIYDVMDSFFDVKNGRKQYREIGDEDPSTGERILTNINVHKHITRGTVITGGLGVEIIITGRQLKLEISLKGKHSKLFIYKGNVQDSSDYQDMADIEAFEKMHWVKVTNKPSMEIDSYEETDEGL